MTEQDYRDEEIIVVKLPRKDYLILKDVIKREEAYSWFSAWIKSWWVWAVAGGILTLVALYDDFKEGLMGTIK